MKKGFTLFEILIVLSVFSLILVAINSVYQSSVSSFRVTAWKQERLRQVESFWPLLKKNLEEAADERDFSPAAPQPTLSHPLYYRSVPGVDGDQMKWIRFILGSNNLCEHKLACRLFLQDRKVFFEVKPRSSSYPPAEVTAQPKKVLDDVTGFVINARNIRQSPLKGDYLDDGNSSLDPAIGSIVEVSLILSPPAGFPTKKLELTHNNKFKILVSSVGILGTTALPDE